MISNAEGKGKSSITGQLIKVITMKTNGSCFFIDPGSDQSENEVHHSEKV